jgi:hypothetical protein
MVLGLLVGGLWNAINLWCLAHLLRAWIGPRPSRRKVLGWLVVKFPLWYAVAIVLLRQPRISMVGFGAGFTLVLLAAAGWQLLSTRRLAFSLHE